MSKKVRKRVTKEQVKSNAEKGGRGGNDWFKLPDGVGRWTPEKAGRFSIDVLPYEVSSKHHPDDVEKECLWYKLPFQVHHGVGASNASLVCPQSVGKPCPECEERDRLYKEDSDSNEDILRTLKPQKFVAYNIVSQEDKDRVDLLILSRGKLASPLEDELKDPDNEEHLAFFDVNDSGRTLRVRFTEESFEGKKFLKATKIDFRARDEMDEDAVLSKTVVLEDALIVPDYDDFKKIFFQEDDEEPVMDELPASKDEDEDEEEEKPKSKTKDEDEDEDEDEKPKAKGKPKDEDEEEDEDEKPKAKSKPKDEDEDEEEDEDEDEKPKAKSKPKDEDEEEEEDEDEKPKAKSKPKDEDEEEDEAKGKPKDEDEEEDEDEKPKAKGKKCKACDGSGKSSKGKRCTPCDGSGRIKSKPKDDEDEEEEEKPKAKKGSKDKSDSPECPHDGGKFGEVDQHDECDDCPHWTACEEASG